MFHSLHKYALPHCSDGLAHCSDGLAHCSDGLALFKECQGLVAQLQIDLPFRSSFFSKHVRILILGYIFECGNFR